VGVQPDWLAAVSAGVGKKPGKEKHQSKGGKGMKRDKGRSVCVGPLLCLVPGVLFDILE